MSATAQVRPPLPIPPLCGGERLSADEFMRRYESMPDKCKAELIDGAVYMASPVQVAGHSDEQALLVTLLGYYRNRTPGVRASIDGTVRLGESDVPQPDIHLRLEPECGGPRIGVDKYLAGAPELAAEISNTSARYDLGPKLKAYQRHGVQEYIVWRTKAPQAFHWFRLRAGVYERLAPDAEGIVRSEFFPGLWLAPAELFADDAAAAQATIERGVASPEHATFVAELASRRNAAADAGG